MKTSQVTFCFCFIFLAAAVIAAPASSAREFLTAVRECPQSGAYRACLMRDFETPKEGPDFVVHEFVGRVTATQIVTIRGRLAGAPAQPHSLKFFEKLGPYDEAGGGFPRLAYLGRSRDNHPIILTNRGPLEILSKKLDVDLTPTVVVIDEARWRSIAQFAGLGVKNVYFERTGQPIVQP